MRTHLASLRAAIVLGTLVATLCSPLSAASAEENGLKVGTGRLHPFFEVSGEYDSQVKIDQASGAVLGGLVLHLKPGFDFENESEQIAFDLRATGDANLYTGLISRGNRSLSYFGGDVDMNLDINRDGAVGVVLADRFAHSDRNTSVAIASGVRSISNEVSASLPIRPGGGALEIIPSFTLQNESFLSFRGTVIDTAVTNARELNYLSYRPSVQSRWRFLPKTAVVLDVSGDYRQYNTPGTGGAPLFGFYSKAGLSGLITPKLSVVVNAGYGRTFLVDPGYNSVIGQVELTFIPNTFTRLKVGYVRSFLPVPQLAWYGDNRIYAGGSVLLGGRLLFDFKGSYDLLSYKLVGRLDNVVGLDLGLRGRITEWFEVGGGYRLDMRISSNGAFGYTRHVVGVLLKVRY